MIAATPTWGALTVDAWMFAAVALIALTCLYSSERQLDRERRRRQLTDTANQRLRDKLGWAEGRLLQEIRANGRQQHALEAVQAENHRLNVENADLAAIAGAVVTKASDPLVRRVERVIRDQEGGAT